MRYHQTKVGNVYVTDPTTGVPHDCHPVAVIPFEDREQVERLTNALDQFITRGDDYADGVQAALREIAAPTPPKPDEPQGLGAVVEDAEEAKWVQTLREGNHGAWCKSGAGNHFRSWGEITAVRVLSEGVVA